jgi:hypothetical protein
MAAFLGDPKFPEVAIASSRGGKIRLYQDLYMQYSRLGFTRMEDRPIAIDGLQKRLIHAFNTNGGYGVFDDGPDGGLLHRSLLWQRGSDERTLDRIRFPVDRAMSVPTWSWMAFRGGIDYLDVPFKKVDWEEQEIRSPWSHGVGKTAQTMDHNAGMELSAMARDFQLRGDEDHEDGRIVYDIPGKTDGLQLKCVVIGKFKEGRSLSDKRHYVLVISPSTSGRRGGNKIYERVGAGYMSGRCIALERSGTAVRIL